MVTALSYIIFMVIVAMAAAANLWLVAIPATLGALVSIYICQHRRNGDHPRVNGLPAAR